MIRFSLSGLSCVLTGTTNWIGQAGTTLSKPCSILRVACALSTQRQVRFGPDLREVASLILSGLGRHLRHV